MWSGKIGHGGGGGVWLRYNDRVSITSLSLLDNFNGNLINSVVNRLHHLLLHLLQSCISQLDLFERLLELLHSFGNLRCELHHNWVNQGLNRQRFRSNWQVVSLGNEALFIG